MKNIVTFDKFNIVTFIMPRLNKAIRELNIGFQTALNFLNAKFGLNDISLNDVITDEQYESLFDHFHKDKVIHSITKKKYQSLSSSRKTNPIQVSYSEEEKEMLNDVEEINLTKYIRGAKGKKKKGKLIRARKGIGNSSKKTGRFDRAFGFIRVISVPFGGMNKR